MEIRGNPRKNGELLLGVEQAAARHQGPQPREQQPLMRGAGDQHPAHRRGHEAERIVPGADRLHQIDHVQVLRQDHHRPADEQMAHHAPEEGGEADAGGQQKIRRLLAREQAAVREQLGIGAQPLKILEMRGQAALGFAGRAGGQADGEDIVAAALMAMIAALFLDPAAPAGIEPDRGKAGRRRDVGLVEDRPHGEFGQDVGRRRTLRIVVDLHGGHAQAQQAERQDEMVDGIGEADRGPVAGAKSA